MDNDKITLPEVKYVASGVAIPAKYGRYAHFAFGPMAKEQVPGYIENEPEVRALVRFMNKPEIGDYRVEWYFIPENGPYNHGDLIAFLIPKKDAEKEEAK